MALTVTNLDELDPVLVEQAQAELTQLIKERHPEVELGRGVIHDIVAFLAGGISGGINQTHVNRVLQSRSLLAINANPALADDTLVDHVLSNFRTTRRSGTRARGTITLVVTGSASVVVTANQPFQATGQVFRADGAFIAKPPGSVAGSSTERVLQLRSGNTYEFTIPVTAEAVGEEGNIRRNTAFQPVQPLARLLLAFAAEDFNGGTSTETNTELVQRLETGIAAPIMQGRANIKKLISETPSVADIQQISVVGFGNPEMLRDQHWVFPVSGGGRVDIYARSTETPKSVTLIKPATLISKDDQGGTWQISIGRDDAPGFYEVVQIRRAQDPTDSGGFNITKDIRGMDLTDSLHDIAVPLEATYTRYQTAVIQFFDGLSDYSALAVGTTANYTVTLLAMPQIADLQALADDPDYSNLAADVLVKAAVPCFMSVNCVILKDPSESAPDLVPIQLAIAKMVNNLEFPGSIAASRIYDVIHDFLPRGSEVSQLDMHGRIRTPESRMLILRDRHQLRVTHAPGALVTANTVAFILDPEDIGITVKNKES